MLALVWHVLQRPPQGLMLISLATKPRDAQHQKQGEPKSQSIPGAVKLYTAYVVLRFFTFSGNNIGIGLEMFY